MYIKNRNASLWYLFCCVILSSLGLLSASGLLEGRFQTNLFVYYTHLSNLLCWVYFILAFLHCYRLIQQEGPVGSSTFLPRFKGAVVLAITVTMLIYWFLLHTPDQNSIQNLLEHLIVPLLMIFDWLLFDPKGAFGKYDPLYWLIIPLAYYGYALLVAQTGRLFGESRFPYFFIDHDVLGPGGVAVYVGVLLLIFLVIGYLFYGLDRYLAKRSL